MCWDLNRVDRLAHSALISLWLLHLCWGIVSFRLIINFTKFDKFAKLGSMIRRICLISSVQYLILNLPVMIQLLALLHKPDWSSAKSEAPTISVRADKPHVTVINFFFNQSDRKHSLLIVCRTLDQTVSDRSVSLKSVRGWDPGQVITGLSQITFLARLMRDRV